MRNRNLFFEEIGRSLCHGRLTPAQRRGLACKLTAFERHGIRDDRWCAYMLATSFHETAGTLQPVEETGKGKGRPYGEKRKRDGSAYSLPDRIYFGRGDVQLTWYENYERMGRLLQLPLLEQPELALVPEISARIMIEGMTRGLSNRGDFTGMALEDFFNDGRDDAVGARRVVNGLDRAHLVARYHAAFLRALRTSKMILFTLTALLLAGCKPGRVVTENRATETDSSAVWVLRDSLQWKDMEMARRRGGGRCCGR